MGDRATYKQTTYKLESRMYRLQRLFPVLVAVFAVSSAMASGAGDHHHASQQDGHGDAHWLAPSAAAKRSNPVAADPASLKRGRLLFKKYCTACHGDKGRGDGPAAAALKPPPSDLSVMAPKHPDGGLAWKIAHGRGAMPPWKGEISEARIWDLVNYLKKGLSPVQHEHADKQHHHAGHGKDE